MGVGVGVLDEVGDGVAEIVGVVARVDSAPPATWPTINPAISTTALATATGIPRQRKLLWLTASCGHVPLMLLVVVGVFVLVFPGWFRIRLGGGSRLMSVGVCDCR